MSTSNKSMKSYLGVIWPKPDVWNWKRIKGLNSVFADLELVIVHLKKIRKLYKFGSTPRLNPTLSYIFTFVA